MTLVDKFWSKVDKGDDCWEWTGHRFWDGYGEFSLPDKRQSRAHRYSWELHFGAIPDGIRVLHRCDNPPCVRPDHLFLGTQADNMRDMYAKGRHRVFPGSANHNAKLTEADVLAIRAERAAGASTGELGIKYGVSQVLISYICIRKAWRHVG